MSSKVAEYQSAVLMCHVAARVLAQYRLDQPARKPPLGEGGAGA